MLLTLGNWIFIGILIVTAICLSLFIGFGADDAKVGIICGLVCLIVILVIAVGISWYHKNTASGERSYKDFQSNMNKGLNREITITAEDGREIFHYDGKIDVETKHEGNANYILFESEEGHRYIIYYGITDTVLIIEK